MTIKILRALLLFLSQQTFVAERGRTSDWSVIVDIVTPTPGQTWEPIVRLNLNVRIENDGDAAEQVRGAPFRFQICVSGAPGRVTCQPLISNNGELLDVAVEPPGEFGFSTLSAWVRHAGAPINEFVGRADHVLLWSSARSAVTGLEAKSLQARAVPAPKGKSEQRVTSGRVSRMILMMVWWMNLTLLMR